MRSGGGKGGHDEEEYEDDDYGSTRRDGATSSNNQIVKEGKLNDPKASATRSKHSVTEQRRRSKINERFQILRDLIPHSDQKRDTASFLLEVIEYVQFLQKTVQKYEGSSYQGWGSGPTKLMPWRNSHWRVQSFGGHPQALKNSSDPGSTFSGKLDESSQTVLTNSQNPMQSDVGRNAAPKADYQQPELVNKVMSMSMPFDANMSTIGMGDDALSHPLHRPVSDAQLPERVTSDVLSQQEELMIEGGTISISSVYSQGLLNTLSQALQTAGLDLSHASISVQIDIGKRASRGSSSGKFVGKDHDDPGASQVMTHANSGDDSDQAHKRLKT